MSVTCSVIIPTFQRASLLSETLDSLAALSEKEFEVIVVCDGEDAETRDLARSYFSTYTLTWIFSQMNAGQAAARNVGANAAKGNVLLFLDDDMVVEKDWVSQHLKYHHTSNGQPALVVCGRITDSYDRPPHTYTERMLRKHWERELDNFETALQSTTGTLFDQFACFGVNCSISQKLFLRLGGFDPLLRYVHEDLEFGSRLKAKAVEFIFEPAALVRHRSTKDLRKYYVQSWYYSGQADAYRLVEKDQRTDQTKGIARLHHNGPIRRLKARIAWDHPRAVRHVAQFCAKATDVTGADSCFRMWSSLMFEFQYWSGVRSTGLTKESLAELVGTTFPILAFHSVSDPTSRTERHYHISSKKFFRFLTWLIARDYSTIEPDQILSRQMPSRPVCLTFDDGYEDFYKEVFPVLYSLGLKAIVFLVANRLGETNLWDQPVRGVKSRRLLSVEQIREMHRYGIQFGSHTLTHPCLLNLSDAELQREVADSKARLEDLLGSEATCFSYPFGDVDKRVRTAVAEAGYKLAMTMESGLNTWSDPLCLKRTGISESDTSFDLFLKLRTGRSFVQQLFEHSRPVMRGLLEFLPEPLSKSIREIRRKLHERPVPSHSRVE